MSYSAHEFSGQIEQFRPAVTRYIRRFLANAAESEDLAQETFLRAHRNAGALHNPVALEGWLYQIATHVAIDYIRKRSHAAALAASDLVEELALPDTRQPSAQTVAQQAEMSACVQVHVAKLPDAYKAVLLLHDVDGMTASEIASLLGLSLTNVKMRLHRARRRLQETLRQACSFSQDERGVFVCDPKTSTTNAILRVL